MDDKHKGQGLPNLPLSTIWMLSFGFLGVQMAFSLQSSQMGRIFQTLGADPTKLGFSSYCHLWLDYLFNPWLATFQIEHGPSGLDDACHIC